MCEFFQRSKLRALLGALLLLSGCGNGVETAAVSGKASYKGQPLANGSVSFYPQSGHPINATIDSAGRYTAELPVGDYRVTVNAAGIEAPAGMRDGKPGAELPTPKLVLPAQYSTRAGTTLNLTVTPNDEPQTADFDLK